MPALCVVTVTEADVNLERGIVNQPSRAAAVNEQDRKPAETCFREDSQSIAKVLR